MSHECFSVYGVRVLLFCRWSAVASVAYAVAIVANWMRSSFVSSFEVSERVRKSALS